MKKIISIIVIILGALSVIAGFGFFLIIMGLKQTTAPSVGIIGGADGPTAIFMSGSSIGLLAVGSILLGLLLLIVGIIVLVVGKKRQ